MADLTVRLVNSHPRTDWLRNLCPNYKVSRKMAELISHDKPEAFFQGMGLSALKGLSEQTATATILTLSPPTGFTRQAAARLLVSKADYPEMKMGTVLLKFAIPEFEEQTSHERAEYIFKEYCKVLEGLVVGIGARPFACLTGCEVDQPTYDLQHRSFKFFFGDEDADFLYANLANILRTNQDLIMLPARFRQMVLDGEITKIDARQLANRRAELQSTLQQMKSVTTNLGTEPVKHTILEEVMLEISDTTLVDLR